MPPYRSSTVLVPLFIIAAGASLPAAASPPEPPARAGAPAAASTSAPAAASTSAPAAASALAGEGFAFIGAEHGVKVYRRDKRPGIELAAEGMIAASPERVRRVLLDYPNHKRWQKHLKENRILARGDGFLDVYERLNLPVLDDRDFSLRVTWGNDSNVLWMRFKVANERGPAPVSGVVRVTSHDGGWRLEPVNGGKSTHAVYRFYLDLAGSFPSWMGKDRATSDIPELFANITKQLPNYR